MTPKEKESAKKIGQIMRTVRKKLSLNQTEISEHLQVVQSNISKMENGLLIPSASQWYDFCKLTNISTDSLVLGFVDSASDASLVNGKRDGLFRIPNKYSENRGSKVRAAFPFFKYLNQCLGAQKAEEYFRHIDMDPDFFFDMDNQINLNFSLDISRFLIEKKFLKRENVANLVGPASQPELHGMLHSKFDQLPSFLERLEMLLENARYYECNFKYQIEGRTRRTLEFSIKPEEHLTNCDYRNDPTLGDFLCRYKQQYFEQFGQYGREPATPKSEDFTIKEHECHYRGAAECIYEVRIS